jgi:peptide/nickel transport system permease protein
MIAYALRRVLQAIVTILGVTVIVFVLFRMIPFGPGTVVLGPNATRQQIAQFAAQPAIVQYLRMVGGWLTGDFGYVAAYNKTVGSIILAGLPETSILVLGAVVLTFLIAIPAGLLQGARHDGIFDRVSSVIAVVCITVPLFLSGPILDLVFTYDIRLLPPDGPPSPDLGTVLLNLNAMILPIVTLALPNIGRFSRIMRSATLDQISSDYVRTAKAKGAGPVRILGRHVLRNSMIPILTFVGLSLPLLFSGALVVEALFNLPGLGYDLWQASQPKHQDFPVEIGVVLVVAIVTVVGNLIVDLLLAVVDPRIIR